MQSNSQNLKQQIRRNKIRRGALCAPYFTKETHNTEHGITLVALVITVIVLLILVMVSISLVMNGGIIDKAEKGTQTYSAEEELEQIKLAVASAKLAGNGFITAENLNSELQKVFNNAETVSESSDSFKYKNNKTYTINKDGSVGEYKSVLPANYKELEYIESTGTQYINTNFRPKSDEKYKFRADFKLIDLEKEIQSVMGNDTFDIRVDQNGFFNGNEESAYIAVNRADLAIEIIPNNGKWIKKIFVNEEIYAQKESNWWYNDYIAIFTNLAYKQQRISKAKVYSAKIWNKDNLIRNFIPCYSTTTVTNANGAQKPANTKGLYDTAEGKFYTNQGSGDDFIAGPNV